MSIMNSFRQRGAKWHSTVVLALLIGPLNALPASAAPYQIIDLGTDVAPTDINNQGTVVGSRRTDMGNIAFRWSAATGIEDIVGATAAHAVNELGQITGTTLSGAFLFDGTLAENIAYSRPSASREEIEEVGRLARCAEFVDGFDLQSREDLGLVFGHAVVAHALGELGELGLDGGGVVDGAGDHRCAMSFCIAGQVASGPVTVHGCHNIDTSYPGFVADLSRLGGRVRNVGPKEQGGGS